MEGEQITDLEMEWRGNQSFERSAPQRSHLQWDKDCHRATCLDLSCHVWGCTPCGSLAGRRNC